MEKNYFKFLTIFVFCLFFSVLSYTNAATFTAAEVLDELEQIKLNVVEIKSDYTDMLSTYGTVIDSLSIESKSFLLNLTSNILDDDSSSKLEVAKLELETLATPESAEVLNSISTFEAQAKAILSDSKSIVYDVKNNLQDYSSDEISQIFNGAKDVITTLGVEVDTISAYNQIVLVLDDVAVEADKFANKLTLFFANHEKEYKKMSTPDVLVSILNGYEENGVDGVILALKNAFYNTDKLSENEKNIILSDLKAMEQDLMNARNAASGISSIDSTALMLLDDTQISNIKVKIKNILGSYVGSINLVLDNYSDEYISDTFSALRSESITMDDVIKYGSKILDYIDGTKEATDMLFTMDLTKVFARFNISFSTLFKAYSASSVLGIDVISTNYVAKIAEKFSEKLSNVTSTLAKEAVKYIEYVSSTTLEQINSANDITSVLNITSNNFTTLEKLENIITRIVASKEDMLQSLEDNEGLKTKLNSLYNIVDFNTPSIYSLYYRNILIGINKITENETTKVGRKYEIIVDNEDTNVKYFLTDSFLTSENIRTLLSIPSKYASIIHLNNSLVKTNEILSIEFSELNKLSYTCVVLGDVYNDGKISSQDYMAIKNSIMGKDSLDKTKLMAADVYRDGEITSQDYMAIKNQIMGKDTISLEKEEK